MFLMTSVAILAIFVSLESLLESCNESRFCLIRSAAYKDKNNDMSKSLPLDIAGCFMATAVASRTSPLMSRALGTNRQWPTDHCQISWVTKSAAKLTGIKVKCNSSTHCVLRICFMKGLELARPVSRTIPPWWINIGSKMIRGHFRKELFSIPNITVWKKEARNILKMHN